MRLKPEKIESLARQVAASLKKMKRLKFAAPADQVEGAVRRVIQNDILREDEIEKEAEAILKQYQQRINMQNMSYNTLLAKTKLQLARQKKIIL